MGDEFDGCECFFSHELAIRRLLSMIRQGQSYCTDTDCIDLTNLPGQSATTNNDESGGFMLMSLFLIFAVILYLIRPNTMRRNLGDVQKPTVSVFNGIERRDDDDSPPPPSVG